VPGGSEDWREIFYPRDLLNPTGWNLTRAYFSNGWIDSTFYAAPGLIRCGRWLDLTPSHFPFFMQTAREITHQWQTARLLSRVERVSARG